MLGARLLNAAAFFVLCATFVGTSQGFEWAVVDYDATIDAASHLAGSRIDVLDGVQKRTEINIVSGGTVAGFVAHDNSVVTLDGGETTYVSSLEDDATFVLKSGTLDCTDFFCQAADFGEFFSARDSSQLYIYGGALFDLRLYDSAEAHIFGNDLSLNYFNPSFAIVEGTYANGEPVNVSFHLSARSADRIFLHSIPESAAVCLCGVVAGIALMRRGNDTSRKRRG